VKPSFVEDMGLGSLAVGIAEEDIRVGDNLVEDNLVEDNLVEGLSTIKSIPSIKTIVKQLRS
jgi:hypothetical protein